MGEEASKMLSALRRWQGEHAELDVDWEQFDAFAAEVSLVDVGDAAVEDIAMGIAAATGAPRAVRQFEKRYFSTAKTALSRMDAAPELAHDALAEAVEELLVSKDGGPPRILRLLGRGDLRGLVKVVAVRRYLNILRHRRARPDIGTGIDDELIAAIAQDEDPEQRASLGQRRDLLKAAFAAALAALPADSRTLLRLSVVHRLSIDDLAGIFGVHRATAARRLANIRASLRLGVREFVAERAEASTAEVDSILKAADSRLEISLDRLLSS